MKVRVLEGSAPVYSRPDPLSTKVADVHAGDTVTLGATAKCGDQTLVAMTLPNGMTGYALGNIRVYRIMQVTVAQKSVAVTEQPAAGSRVLLQCTEGTKLTCNGIAEEGGAKWVEVATGSGAVGYIPGETKIKEIGAAGGAAPKSGVQNMVAGGVICLIGIAITVVTYGMASSGNGGGTYVIAWGPAIFGGIQFVKGFIQMVSED